jgi:hypothetical protein
VDRGKFLIKGSFSMSSKNKMNESDQNGVLIVSGCLGGVLLLVKVAKLLPMILLGLFFGPGFEWSLGGFKNPYE